MGNDICDDSGFCRNYALETLCKMSVIENNVDLLLSTGPWSRLEEFVKVLASLLTMKEDVPSRYIIHLKFSFEFFFSLKCEALLLVEKFVKICPCNI